MTDDTQTQLHETRSFPYTSSEASIGIKMDHFNLKYKDNNAIWSQRIRII